MGFQLKQPLTGLAFQSERTFAESAARLHDRSECVIKPQSKETYYLALAGTGLVTRMVKGCRRLSFEERLEKLNLTAPWIYSLMNSSFGHPVPALEDMT